MSRLFYHVMQDNAGNLLFDVSGTMRLAGTGTAATIYGDEALTIPIANPMTNHPSFGSFKCFLGAGDYDFYMAKSGYTFETLTGVQGHGTMAQQDASAVAITGGSATLGALGVTGTASLAQIYTPNLAGTPVIGWNTNIAAGGGTRYNLYAAGTAPNFMQGQLGLATTPIAGVELSIAYTGQHGIFLRPSVDTGASWACGFTNTAGTPVGTITTTATATAYNTSSDVRLKHAVTALTGALGVVQALRPVAFTWNADNSPGVGFIASEVQQVLPDAGIITGLPDAMDDEGRILPQMIDPSKLVVWLVGACKTLAAKLESAEARLHVLEDALGL